MMFVAVAGILLAVEFLYRLVARKTIDVSIGVACMLILLAELGAP